MAGLDLSSRYILTNSYTLSSKQLASNGETVFMDSVSEGDAHQWFLSSTTSTGYYRLHTAENGNSTALDVVNDNGTSSTGVHFADSGDYSGQFWRFDDWGDGTLRLSNAFTGPDMHLDTYSNTFEPFLGDGDHTGQHWTFSKLAMTTLASTASSSTETAHSDSSSVLPNSASSSFTNPSSSPSPSKSTALPTGAIVGIAVGGLLALTLLVCGILFFLRWRRKTQMPASELAGQDVSNDKTVYAMAPPVLATNQHPVELYGGVVQGPVEAPSQRY